jgi:AraC-like DNA-binding protein
MELEINAKSYSIESTAGALSKSMFYYVQSCGYFDCKKGYETNRKDYNSMLLLYTLSGKGYLEYRGKNYCVEKGQVFLIDCMDQQLYFIGEEGTWEFKYVHFNGSESKKYVERIIENSGPVLNVEKESILAANIDKIFNQCAKNDKRTDIVVSCLIVEVLTELLLTSYNYNNENSIIPWYIEKAAGKIEREYRQKLSLDVISKELNINKFYLTKQFRKYTGQSLYEYLINYRLNLSKKLLKTSMIPICEIAEQVGFESVSHFIKIFRNNENTTPLKFRKYWI